MIPAKPADRIEAVLPLRKELNDRVDSDGVDVRVAVVIERKFAEINGAALRRHSPGNVGQEFETKLGGFFEALELGAEAVVVDAAAVTGVVAALGTGALGVIGAGAAAAGGGDASACAGGGVGRDIGFSGAGSRCSTATRFCV